MTIHNLAVARVSRFYNSVGHRINVVIDGIEQPATITDVEDRPGGELVKYRFDDGTAGECLVKQIRIGEDVIK